MPPEFFGQYGVPKKFKKLAHPGDVEQILIFQFTSFQFQFIFRFSVYMLKTWAMEFRAILGLLGLLWLS